MPYDYGVHQQPRGASPKASSPLNPKPRGLASYTLATACPRLDLLNIFPHQPYAKTSTRAPTKGQPIEA